MVKPCTYVGWGFTCLLLWAYMVACENTTRQIKQWMEISYKDARMIAFLYEVFNKTLKGGNIDGSGRINY